MYIFSDIGLCQETEQTLYSRCDEPSRTDAYLAELPTQPRGEHHLPVESEFEHLSIQNLVLPSSPLRPSIFLSLTLSSYPHPSAPWYTSVKKEDPAFRWRREGERVPYTHNIYPYLYQLLTAPTLKCRLAIRLLISPRQPV